MMNLKLQIYPQPSTESLLQRFNLIGAIDVDATAQLETLYVLPPESEVVLDFAMLQRVNSMGLAQLLKLFEHWQQQNISIRIVNSNRMIAVLFKMTGLSRYLSYESPEVQAASKKPEASATAAFCDKAVEVIEKYSPMSRISQLSAADLKEIMPLNVSSQATSHSKLKMWVSVENSEQLNGWYFFNTYLQRHLGRDIQLVLEHGAITDHNTAIEETDIVFTKPFEACRLMLEQNFSPLVRPSEQNDEVTIVVRADDPRQKLSDFHDAKIVTATEDNFVYILGRFLFEGPRDIDSHLHYLFSGHDIKALQMLIKGNADILFILSKTYHSFSALTRRMLREIDQSETAFAFHLFCLAPHCQELATAITEVLVEMNHDRQGQQVLLDLNIKGWMPPKPDEIQMMAMLFQRYAGIDLARQNVRMAHAG